MAEGEARIITRGERHGVDFETRYSLDLQHPEQIRIHTRLERKREGDRVFVFGDTVLHGSRQLAPFSLSTRDPGVSRGFHHPRIDVDQPIEMIRAIGPADLQVLVGDASADPGIAYGLWLRRAELIEEDGTRTPLPFVAINGKDFTLLGIFTRPFWLGDSEAPGLLELAQTLFMDLESGEKLEYERWLMVGHRADASSITDRVWNQAAIVSGRVDDARAHLFVKDRNGNPFTTIRPEANGSFGFRLPAGAYRLDAKAPGARTLAREFEVEDANIDLGRLALGPPTRVALPKGSPMRLVFKGLGDTPDPRFGDDGRDFREGERAIPSSQLTDSVSLAGVDSDPSFVDLAPGQYRVLATRGLEFGVTQSRIDLTPGETKALVIHPPGRVLKAPDWVSADLHVHSGFSDDSGLPIQDRLAAFRAQGANIIVSTEHDRIVDYAPYLKDQGLEDHLTSVVGVEITTTVRNQETPFTAGHSNAFPVEFRPGEYRGGAPAAEGRRLRETIATQRATGRRGIFQLNHPRPAGGHLATPDDGDFLTHLSTGDGPYDPTLPLDAKPNRNLVEADPRSGLRDLDFDAMELLNGSSMPAYWANRADWFSFLLQGEIRTATANSDSHTLGHLVALPLNYVAMKARAPFDEAAFVKAIAEGRSYGTTGPLLDIRLGTAEIGQRHTGRQGILQIGVKAAHWIPVTEARVYINGRLDQRRPIQAGSTATVPLTFDTDAFVTVEVQGPIEGIYADVATGYTPFAFSNPIFVDADGDGTWTPPGLPAALPDTLRNPTGDHGQPSSSTR